MIGPSRSCALVCALVLLAPARALAAPPTDTPSELPPDDPATGTGSADEPTEPPAIGDGVRPEERIVQEFDRHWNEGERLYGRREYSRAAVEFERAYAAVPFAAALYSVIISYADAGDDVAAATAATRYLELPVCGGEADKIRCASTRDRGVVEKMYGDLRARLVELSLDVSTGVSLREIRIGGRIVAAKSFPIFVEPGTVEIELVGTEAGQRIVELPKLRAGELYIVRARPFPKAKEPDRDGGIVQPPTKPRNTKALRITFWSGLGLTIAAGAGLVTAGVLTRRYKQDYDRTVASLCGPDSDDPDDLMDCGEHPFAEKRRFERSQLATNVLIGVTAGVAMVTTIVGIFAFAKPRERNGNQRASTKVRLRPAGAGLTLSF
jgi:hypothetical protein